MRSVTAFLVTAILIVLSLHWYMWWRLVRAPGWPAPWSTLLTGVVALLGLLVPVAMPLVRSLPRDSAQPLAWLSYGWMGLGFLLVVFLFAGDLARWTASGATSLFALLGAAPAVDPARRELLARGTAGVASLAALGLGGLALRGAREVAVKDVEVKLARLPERMRGFRILQLSDVHIGPTIGRDFIEKIVTRTNAQDPDLVVITGDLVDGSVGELARHAEPLRELRAKHGVFFVTGNHEYYSGARSWVAHLRSLGIRVLENEHVRIGDDEASFDLAGINDFHADRGGMEGPDFDKALAGREPGREVVLLAHQPKAIEEAAKRGVGLQLSGHTHGGQLWPFTGLVHLAHRYVAGLHRHGELTQIYVSRGTGYWGPPMRLAAPAEITKITLV